MTRTILLLALVVLLTAAIYIIKDIYRAEPVIVAATDEPGGIWPVSYTHLKPMPSEGAALVTALVSRIYTVVTNSKGEG